MPFPFEPQLARASTPPPGIYTNPAVLEQENARIFQRTWQLVAHAGELAADGDQVPVTVGGAPLVLVRDGAALRAFHNVCRHRGGPLATACARRRTLQCRYHGWTYALDGRLARAPEMDGTLGFDPAEIALAPVRVAAFGPLVFANLDPDATPLDRWMGDLPDHAATLRLPDLRHLATRDYPVACNWKVYVDNYLEGYHLPMVHPGLLRELDYENYRVEPRGHYSLQHAPLRAVAGAAGGRRYLPAPGDDRAFYYWFFPNLMWNAYQGILQTNLVLPQSVDRCLVRFAWFSAEPPAPARLAELIAFSDEIQAEDATICEAVQKNLSSPACRPGRYSALRENGVHHFHGLLHDWLRAGDA